MAFVGPRSHAQTPDSVAATGISGEPRTSSSAWTMPQDASFRVAGTSLVLLFVRLNIACCSPRFEVSGAVCGGPAVARARRGGITRSGLATVLQLWLSRSICAAIASGREQSQAPASGDREVGRRGPFCVVRLRKTGHGLSMRCLVDACIYSSRL